MKQKIAKKLGRIKRYIFYQTTMDDLKEDLDNNRIDFGKYQTTLYTGEVFYRFVDKGDDPLRPTGKKSRFVSEPDNFPFEEYREAYYKNELAQMPTLGTGGISLAECFPTAVKEVPEPFDKDWWELRLTKNLSVVDLEALCKDKRIPFELAKERHDAYQLLYGKKLIALRFRSSKQAQYAHCLPFYYRQEYNLYIYTDWFQDYKNFFKATQIEGKLRDYFIKLFQPTLSSLNLLQNENNT